MNDLLPGIPRVESPFFDDFFGPSSKFDDETCRIANDLRTNGFAVLEFPCDHFDELAETVIEKLNRVSSNPGYTDLFEAKTAKLHHGYRFIDEIKQIAANHTILQLLEQLYGRKPFPFQTLNFFSGSQQGAHTDMIQFSSLPERFMCAAWLALEDCDSKNGPLIYYPGSHRLNLPSPEQTGVPSGGNRGHARESIRAMRTIMEKMEIEPVEFHARKGQMGIWAANLFHGGAKQIDATRTRHSQVTHYLFHNCVHYSPYYSDPVLGKISIRRYKDIETDSIVEPSYCGQPLGQDFLDRVDVGRQGEFW